jgi:hypothetical protein
MFNSVFKLVKNVVMLPVTAAIDAVNVVTLGSIDDTREEFYTETALKNVGQSAKKIIDDVLED